MRVLKYVVPQEDDGRLIRRVARGRLGISSHQLARAKALGALCLDGESVHADRVVRAGQVVSVTLMDEETAAVPIRPENASVSVVYEDDDLYVIDKPAPLSTQSSPRQPDNTLENRLAWRYRDVPGFVFRPVNRLDKGTSGLMIAAKHAHSQMLLSRQLHTPAFVREYLAVTEGVPAVPEGVIDAPIGKVDGATVCREVRADGKPSRTLYRTLQTGSGRALLRLRLDTGRTHQIRVHLAHIGSPVFGDFLYGTERPDVLPERFALHSALVRFLHPLMGQVLEFESPLPEALRALLPQTGE